MVTATEGHIGLQFWFYEITIKNLIKYIIPDLIATVETLCVHVCRGLCVSVHMYKCMCVCFIYYNQSLRFLEIKQPQVKFYCFWFLVTQRNNNILSHSSLCSEFFLKKHWGNCVDSFKISLRFSFTNAYSDLTSRGSQFPAGSTVQWGLSRAIWGLFHNTASIRPLPCCASPQKKPRLLCLAFLVCRIQPLLPAPPLFSLSPGLALSPTFCFLLTASPIGHPRRNTRQCPSHQCRFHLPNLTNSSLILSSAPEIRSRPIQTPALTGSPQGRWDQRPFRDSRSAT